MCISYDRVLHISNSIALSTLKKYERGGVFVANSLLLEVFTIIAKDNIDFNARSTKVSNHFHGISMTIMQHLFIQTRVLHKCLSTILVQIIGVKFKITRRICKFL